MLSCYSEKPHYASTPPPRQHVWAFFDMSLLLSPWVWRAIAATVVLASLTWVYNWWADGQREIGRDEVRAEWNIDKLARAESNRLLLMANAKRQGDLQVAADKERKTLNDKNRNTARRLADALDRLRERPERPEPADSGDGVSENPGLAGTGPRNQSCTGAGLYREDGQFLAREAADTSRLQAALRTCLAGYGRAQATVNGE